MVEEVSEKELEEAKKKAKELQARNVSLTRPNCYTLPYLEISAFLNS